MKKRRTWVTAALAVFACGLVVAYWVTYDRITLNNFNLIKWDMSRSELHWMLGGPLGKPDQTELRPKGRECETWIGREGAILLHFDANDKLFWLEWDDHQWRRTWLTEFGFGRQNIRE